MEQMVLVYKESAPVKPGRNVSVKREKKENVYQSCLRYSKCQFRTMDIIFKNMERIPLSKNNSGKLQVKDREHCRLF